MAVEPITGIVLAGGKSSRMGTDKALLEWNGKTLIEHAIDILKPLCSHVVISANRRSYAFTGCETWEDALPVEASMIGIYSCLKRSQTQLNLVLSCDMPQVPSTFLEILLQNSENQSAVVPLSQNFAEPLCALYSKTILPKMQEYIENQNFRLHQFLKSIGAKHLSINELTPKFSPDIFSNINTPGELEKLKGNK